MINIEKARRNDRAHKALTGLSVEEFDELLLKFKQSYNHVQKKINRNKKRQRKTGAGRKHTLEELLSKQFYILFYMKCYPTYDIAAVLYEVDKSQTNRWVGELLPVLEFALGKTLSLPQRKIRSLKEFFELFPEVKEIIVDGTERPIQRPKNKEKQKGNYSGKKKRHTNKNIIIVTKKKRVLYVSPTEQGKEHDYTIFKKNKLHKKIPEHIKAWFDLGFKGIEKESDLNVRIPIRKPRTRELTKTQKTRNKAISRVRVKVENAIAGIKRFRCITDVCRTKIEEWKDKFMLLSAGLWNYHLQMI